LRWSPSTIELVWSILAVIGIVGSTLGVVIQTRDYRNARLLHNGLRTRRLIVTWMMLRNEVASVIVQCAFLLLGIMALFTAGGRDPDDLRRRFGVAILWALVVAELALVSTTLLRRRDRRQLRQITLRENGE
jgi:hypothetical protein